MKQMCGCCEEGGIKTITAALLSPAAKICLRPMWGEIKKEKKKRKGLIKDKNSESIVHCDGCHK